MKNITGAKPKVYVAMSGGVDSSVSAALLKSGACPELGRRVDVVGVYMRQWSPKILGAECIWKTDSLDSMQVCAKLGIPFLTWDFSKEYEKEVGKYMIDSYKKGITPNPDVMCNNIIKFGLFFDRAIKEGADFVVTGHYAIIKNEKLLKAKDKNKDQTYFLYGIKKSQLAKIIFPVGNLEKPKVRKLAKKFKLENAEKKDSQGVCFVGKFNMKNFLKMYINPKKGKILSLDEKIIGEHDGIFYYTIGQRRGLDIKNGKGPYFVVKKDVKKNIIYVGKEKDLYSKKAKIKNINWINKPKVFPVLVDAAARYRSPLKKAELHKNGMLIFKKSDRAITEGQSVVFYKGKELLGGGVIK